MSVHAVPISEEWPRDTRSSRRGRTLRATVAAILMAAALSGCAGRGPCDPIQPRLLPDGSVPGDPTVELGGDGVVVVTWGSSDSQRVTERIVRPDAAGREACPPKEAPLELGCFPPDDQTTVGDRPAVFMAADARPTSAVTMAFVEGPCVYEITVGPGYSTEQVKAYAAGF